MKYPISFDIELLKNPHPGLYIALEGIDGAGKTTQAQDLKKYFESKGKTVVTTREPRKEGILGELTHQILTAKVKFPPEAIQYLFSADRVIHHAQIVKPALARGEVVITDRCFWSAIVYGVMDKMGDDYNEDSVEQLLVAQGILSMYHQFIVPDRSFYLKISVDESLKRISGKAEREIYETRGKIQKAYDGYEWVHEKFKDQITVLDGEVDEKQVTKDIIKSLEEAK
jgi:dTMP kinase